jgi:hypothetical protein
MSDSAFDLVWSLAVDTVSSVGFGTDHDKTSASSSGEYISLPSCSINIEANYEYDITNMNTIGFYPAMSFLYQAGERNLEIQLSAIVVDDDSMVLYCSSNAYSRNLNIKPSKFSLSSTHGECRELAMSIKYVLLFPLLSPHCESPLFTAMQIPTLRRIISCLAVSRKT